RSWIMNELKPAASEFTGEMNALAAAPDGNPDRFVNREFSWLQFNRRVLDEAENPNHPLLERMRFLSISAANLDEFFMVRVAGLAGQVRQGILIKSPDGRTPQQQLELLLFEVARLQEDQQRVYAHLTELLRQEGIEVIRAENLEREELEWLDAHFMEAIFPVLTPLSRSEERRVGTETSD